MNYNLLDNFYTVLQSDFSTESQNNFNVVIRLNPKHPIYKGHFEQIPITPGVCQVQLIKELLQSNFGQKLILERADSIKYLGMINPETQAELSIQLNVSPSDDALSVTASISSETAVFMKFKGSFKRL